ncbi:MAG TPA: (2Fe-2S) ferredoxin domain-containing protein [Bryobacteraceae bacterium]|nr:(2Fe-2S) ferredoxin domain-containing protein [Bryobacteraceae bacterium]
MPKTSDYPLQTKRMVIGHVLVCHGCCCGDVDRGKPEVPVDWLKQEWRKRGLLKNIQLSICGCLGPCDLANVVKVSSSDGDVWLGNITHFRQYRDLVDWASQSKIAGRLLPLPKEFQELRFFPFVEINGRE